MKPELKVLSGLGKMTAPIIAVYLAVKIGDVFIRESFKYIVILDVPSWMFITEIAIMVRAFFMFLSKKTENSPTRLFIASSLVIAAVLLNRINNFIIAYNPFDNPVTYYPSFGEISVTVGCIALLVLVYRAIVMIFPVISHEKI
jgi:Ni/Fe-hydrogenase subunit HybB-like protein